MLKIVVFLSVVMSATLAPRSVMGQDPTATPQTGPTEDPVQIELRRDFEREKLRTALADQKKLTLTAILPPASNDPANKTLDGRITVEDKPTALEIESAALSYESLSITAKQISAGVIASPGDFKQFVIYDEDFPLLTQYRIFESQAVPALEALLLNTDLKNRGNTNLTRGVGPEILQMPFVGTSLVKSAIDFIALFRTDTTISNTTVAIDDTALGALVASEIRIARPSAKVYFPRAYIPESDWEPADDNAVLTQLTKLYAYQGIAKQIISDYDKTAAADKEKHPFQRQIPALKDLNEQVVNIIRLESIAGPTSTNRLHDLVRAEQLNRMLESDPKTGILQLKVLKQGGSERITRNLIFGSKISHSGSAIVEYVLFDKDGAVNSSRVFYHHTGFQKLNSARSSAAR